MQHNIFSEILTLTGGPQNTKLAMDDHIFAEVRSDPTEEVLTLSLA